ncbi:hypothetical protein P8452_69316 [Trifolium repens]|jgi:hypothetical protein|nr:hypothetical protein P8452_69316 [Trifolium repens]
MIVRNEVNAQTDKIKGEICSHDDQISDMKRYICELKVRLKELVIDKTTLDQVNKLELRVLELELEVTRQNGVIADKAEETKEAIRQLRFTIALPPPFIKHKRCGGYTVIAS